DCFTEDTAPFLAPLGSGIPVSVVVPTIAPADFGPPDASGGLYLPIRLRTSAGTDKLDAAFLLRLAQGGTPNQNPRLDQVLIVPAMGAPMPTDEMTPAPVHADDHITLRATFVPGSAEMYQINLPGQSKAATELLRVSWFATSGSFSEAATGEE